MENISDNTDYQVDDKDLSNSTLVVRTLQELKNKLDSLLDNIKKTNVVNGDKKSKQSKRVKNEKVYALSELHKEFVKKHQITEAITEKQLESYLQYYFDVKTNEMKTIKDDYKKWLNLPAKEYQIIKKAFDERKNNVVPKKEDSKYFMGLLENKKASVDFNNATYNLTDPKGLANNRELFSVSCNGDNVKSKTLYRFNSDFADVLKEAGVLLQSFDSSKTFTESNLIELFNRYNYNQTQLYQAVDLKNKDLLNLLNVDESNYVVLNYIYIRPKVLKEHLNMCTENGNLTAEYLSKLESYKFTNFNSLVNHLKNISILE
jgi:hypothetical protein